MNTYDYGIIGLCLESVTHPVENPGLEVTSCGSAMLLPTEIMSPQ
jgi:hypothetical protein